MVIFKILNHLFLNWKNSHLRVEKNDKKHMIAIPMIKNILLTYQRTVARTSIIYTTSLPREQADILFSRYRRLDRPRLTNTAAGIIGRPERNALNFVDARRTRSVMTTQTAQSFSNFTSAHSTVLRRNEASAKIRVEKLGISHEKSRRSRF